MINATVRANINGLSLKDVNGAIALVQVLLTGDTVKPEARPGVEEKLALLVERRHRLIVTRDRQTRDWYEDQGAK